MSLFGNSRREGLLAVLLLLLLSVVMHAPGLFFGKPRLLDPEQTKILHDREVSTNQTLLMPAMQAAGQVARQGEVPLWNPYSRLGEPFLSTGAPLLYPPFWLLMVEGGWRLLDLLLCLHTFLACTCMYRFLRNLPLSRYVSFLGGAMYGLGWFMTVQLDRLPHAAAAALIPLAMGMTWRLLIAQRRKLYAFLLAGTIALTFTTGGTSTAFLGMFLCLAVYVLGFLALDSDDRRASMRAAVGASAMVLLLTGPLWVSFWSHATCHAPSAEAAHRHLQPGGLLGLLSPTAFGGMTGAAPEALRAINPDSDPMELALFPGALILFLVFLGLLRPKRTTHGLIWVVVGGIGLLLTLDSPIADFFGKLAFWHTTSPGTGLVLLNIALVSLGSVALEGFFEAPARRHFAVPLTACLVLALTIFTVFAGYVMPELGSGWLARLSGTEVTHELNDGLSHLFISLIQPLVFASLIAMAFLFWYRMGVLRFKMVLAALAITDVLLVGFLHTPRTSFPEDSALVSSAVPEGAGRVITVGRRPTIQTGRLMGAGLPTISTTSTAILDRTKQFLAQVDPSMLQVHNRTTVAPLLAEQLLEDPLLELAGVGIGLSTHEMHVPGFAPIVATSMAETGDDAALNVHVYRRHRTPPRVRVLFQAYAVTGLERAVAALEEHATHLDETVVIENADPDFACKRPGAGPEFEVVEDGATRVRIKVDMGQGRGYLLLSDAFAPGWEAYIDGVRATIHPADVAMRAVAVPEGVHDVVFTYAPAWWWLGFPIAGLGALLGLVWIFLPKRGSGEPRRTRAANPHEADLGPNSDAGSAGGPTAEELLFAPTKRPSRPNRPDLDPSVPTPNVKLPQGTQQRPGTQRPRSS